VTAAREAPTVRQLAPFAALSATYFAHIGFFNPYLTLWLQSLGLPLVVISLLASIQSVTRVFAPYAWGALSDHTGERVRLLRIASVLALVSSFGLWWSGGPWWAGGVLLVLFTATSSMMSLTEAAMAHLVAGDWGRYGRVRLWGSLGFMVTVFAAGAWFERFGMGHFPGWTLATLLLVLACTWWLPDVRDKPEPGSHAAPQPVWPVLRQPAVRWFFVSLFFHVMSHYAVYAYLSLFLDARGYSKTWIGVLWAISVVVEVIWFFWQGRLLHLQRMTGWLVVCGAAAVLRMGLTGGAADSLAALVVAQALHALTFATHHTACIALITQHFPGRLRARGQALFTVIGYGLGGVLGVIAGGALAARTSFEWMYFAAAAAALIGTVCATRAARAERDGPAS
jgi:PPP family 3-phenylpropionic acid transporter